MRRLLPSPQADRPTRRERGSSSLQGRLSILVGAVLAVCAVTIATSGGTFALWNSQATVSPATITAGSLNLSIGTQNLAGLATKLMPGASVLGTYDVVYSGGSDADLVAAVAVGSSAPAGMAGALTLTLTPLPSTTTQCVKSMAGTSAKLNAYAPTTAIVLPASTTAVPTTTTRYCVELKLDTNAPNELMNGTASFTVTYTATQRTS